jgi:hypothetical protein
VSPRLRRVVLGACIALAGSLPIAATLAAPEIAPPLAQRLDALDCDRLSSGDVASVLATVPAPQVIAMHGSVPIVTMEPFAEFLQRMGYPAERLVNPRDGARTTSSRLDSARLAGWIAWHYERDGLMPLLIGHSQGGMVVIRLLHDLAGTRGPRTFHVWDPREPAPESRTTIVDPRTGAPRDVAGLRLPFAAVLATGSLPRFLLGQWGMLPLLRDIPDSVDEFLGFSIPWDPIAGTFAEPPPFTATGSARVRNVVLPASYSHIDLPRTAHLASQPATRAWIEDFTPGSSTPPPADADVANLVHAAELWHAVKRQWCRQAKDLAGLTQR